MHSLTLNLPDAAATDHLAETIAPWLTAGDTVLLTGQIGAGKSHFSRALIRQRLQNPQEDVPSPTFTLVQTYDATPPLWHADLYRLTHPDEVLELGLEDAFQTAICLIEWPDKLGSDAPTNAVQIRLTLHGDGRRADIQFAGRDDLARALRSLAMEEFLHSAGWDKANRQPLAGDASSRRYFRLFTAKDSRILMDNPPGGPDRVADFVRIDRHLRGIGLSAPRIEAEDVGNGFLLLEDFGDARFSILLQTDPTREAPLYAAATDVLIAMQAAPAPDHLPDLSAADWAEAAMLCLSFYRCGLMGEKTDSTPLKTALTEAIVRFGGIEKVLIHRDYHIDNLMILQGRSGLAQVGLLDFQLAQMGSPAYDLVSLLQDARRDVSPEVERDMRARFAKATGAGTEFDLNYAIWGAQRALRIIGIFAKLTLQDGKPDYLVHLPRVMGQLRRNLAGHDVLKPLADLCAELLPEPTPEALNRLRSQCGSFR